jgi:hypothetical protein
VIARGDVRWPQGFVGAFPSGLEFRNREPVFENPQSKARPDRRAVSAASAAALHRFRLDRTLWYGVGAVSSGLSAARGESPLAARPRGRPPGLVVWGWRVGEPIFLILSLIRDRLPRHLSKSIANPLPRLQAASRISACPPPPTGDASPVGAPASAPSTGDTSLMGAELAALRSRVRHRGHLPLRRSTLRRRGVRT